MLIQFKVQNFRSIRDEQTLSLVASSARELPDSVIQTEERLGVNLLRTAAIYGPNASGKSNLAKSILFMRDMIVQSQANRTPGEPIPVTPFGLDSISTGLPSTFEIELLIENVRYRYGFTVNTRQVLEEWLHVYPNGVKQTWFTRTAGSQYKFSRNLRGKNREITRMTRDNSLFLSAAAQNNHAQITPIYLWFAKRLNIVNKGNREFYKNSAFRICADDTFREMMVEILNGADLGIVGMEIRDEGVLEKWKSDLKNLDIELSTKFDSLKIPTVSLKHTAGSNDPVTLPFYDESDGTQALFSLLLPIIEAISRSGVLFIDEIEASLHPHLAHSLISLFLRNELHKLTPQLIFSTHDTNLLDADLLRRDQVWLTEKDKSGSTQLYPLSDFKPKPAENLRRGYLQGRYGAIPFVGFSSLFDSPQE